MRQLKEYIDRQCLVSGFLELWEEKRPSTTGVLLTKCVCEGLDGWSHSEDHLWVYLESSIFEKCMRRFGWTRLDKIAFAGTVNEYRRGNGTIDIGVTQDPTLIRWSRFRDETIPELASYGRWDKIIEAIDSGKVYNDFSDLDRAAFLRDLQGKRTWASVQRPLKEPRPLAPLSLEIPKAMRRKPKGFGNA